MVEEYRIKLLAVDEIVLMRVDNGWLIRSASDYNASTPLSVAETPDKLVSIVRTWAGDQQSRADAADLPVPILRPAPVPDGLIDDEITF